MIMDEKIRIVVDAMGGDNAPEAPIHGAVDALAENNKIEITLVGVPRTLKRSWRSTVMIRIEFILSMQRMSSALMSLR